MKAFIASLIILSVLLGSVTWYSIYVSSVLCDIEKLSEEISKEDRGAFESLSDAWEKNELLVSISTSHNKIDALNKTLSILESMYENEGFDEFYKYKAILREEIGDISVNERISLDNIL